MTIEVAILLLALLILIAVIWVGFDVISIKRILKDNSISPSKAIDDNTKKRN